MTYRESLLYLSLLENPSLKKLEGGGRGKRTRVAEIFGGSLARVRSEKKGQLQGYLQGTFHRHRRREFLRYFAQCHKTYYSFAMFQERFILVTEKNE